MLNKRPPFLPENKIKFDPGSVGIEFLVILEKVKTMFAFDIKIVGQ